MSSSPRPVEMVTSPSLMLDAQPQDLPLMQLLDVEHWISDRWTALLHALIASFSVILVSELGDKTFIITIIMAMESPRSLVLIASAGALLTMTILSVSFGVAVAVIPKVYTHYASILLFVCFGFKMLKEAFDMENQEMEKDIDEVERSLEEKGTKKIPTRSTEHKLGLESDPGQLEASQGVHEENPADGSKFSDRFRQALSAAPLAINIFTLVFVAEWGDRSQISTIILAAREDIFGVFIGSFAGHLFCTALAVIGGRFVAKLISVRTVTFVGGIIFLFFAAFAIVCGPE